MKDIKNKLDRLDYGEIHSFKSGSKKDYWIVNGLFFLFGIITMIVIWGTGIINFFL